MFECDDFERKKVENGKTVMQQCGVFEYIGRNKILTKIKEKQILMIFG